MILSGCEYCKIFNLILLDVMSHDESYEEKYWFIICQFLTKLGLIFKLSKFQFDNIWCQQLTNNVNKKKGLATFI